MYEANYQTLARICAEKSVIRHVSRHRNPDGSLDISDPSPGDDKNKINIHIFTVHFQPHALLL